MSVIANPALRDDKQHCKGSLAPLSVRATGQLAAGPVAQWLEPAAHNGLVAGSSPAGPTSKVSNLVKHRFLRRTIRGPVAAAWSLAAILSIN
jgi:hypothetical protein